MKLYNLRVTWKEIHFPFEITNEIDRNIRVIDPNWPLVLSRKRKSTCLNDLEKPKIKIAKNDFEEQEPSSSWTAEQILSQLASVNCPKNLSVNVNEVKSESLNPNEKVLARRLDSPQNNRKYPHVWVNEIHGFPQMPQIGTDPRLLYKCPFLDPNKTVTINNEIYDVYLDRIQPLVFDNGFFKAVRFSCSYIKIIIDGTLFELSTNQVNFIMIQGQPVTLCIGGPFHEIIINGWPFHVPMTSETFTINMGPVQIDIAFKVLKPFRLKTMNPIPAFIFDWVESDYFGHPKTLNIPPLNPLTNPILQDPLSIKYRNENQLSGNNWCPTNQMPAITTSMTTVTPPIIQTPNQTLPLTNVPTQYRNSDPSPYAKIDMILNELLLSGYQVKELDIDITKYNHEAFLIFDEYPEHEYQCQVCFKKFYMGWEQKEDGNDGHFIIVDAVIVDDKTYHQNCIEDIGKSFETIEDDSGEEVLERKNVDTNSM